MTAQTTTHRVYVASMHRFIDCADKQSADTLKEWDDMRMADRRQAALNSIFADIEKRGKQRARRKAALNRWITYHPGGNKDSKGRHLEIDDDTGEITKGPKALVGGTVGEIGQRFEQDKWEAKKKEAFETGGEAAVSDLLKKRTWETVFRNAGGRPKSQTLTKEEKQEIVKRAKEEADRFVYKKQPSKETLQRERKEASAKKSALKIADKLHTLRYKMSQLKKDTPEYNRVLADYNKTMELNDKLILKYSLTNEPKTQPAQPAQGEGKSKKNKSKEPRWNGKTAKDDTSWMTTKEE